MVDDSIPLCGTNIFSLRNVFDQYLQNLRFLAFKMTIVQREGYRDL